VTPPLKQGYHCAGHGAFSSAVLPRPKRRFARAHRPPHSTRPVRRQDDVKSPAPETRQADSTRQMSWALTAKHTRFAVCPLQALFPFCQACSISAARSRRKTGVPLRSAIRGQWQMLRLGRSAVLYSKAGHGAISIAVGCWDIFLAKPGSTGDRGGFGMNSGLY